MTTEDTTKKAGNNTTVNFYILPDSDLDRRLGFVFRLVEKAVTQKLPTLVVASDETQLKAIDKLIWTVKPETFIAHEIVDNQLSTPLPMVLLTDEVSKMTNLDFSPQVVIDLSYQAIPLSFPKIMLIANQHEEVLANARMKYQSYINTGIKPTVYKL